MYFEKPSQKKRRKREQAIRTMKREEAKNLEMKEQFEKIRRQKSRNKRK